MENQNKALEILSSMEDVTASLETVSDLLQVFSELLEGEIDALKEDENKSACIRYFLTRSHLLTSTLQTIDGNLRLNIQTMKEATEKGYTSVNGGKSSEE